MQFFYDSKVSLSAIVSPFGIPFCLIFCVVFCFFFGGMSPDLSRWLLLFFVSCVSILLLYWGHFFVRHSEHICEETRTLHSNKKKLQTEEHGIMCDKRGEKSAKETGRWRRRSKWKRMITRRTMMQLRKMLKLFCLLLLLLLLRSFGDNKHTINSCSLSEPTYIRHSSRYSG